MMEFGRAPAHWIEEMARATAWLDGPGIASAWVRSWGIDTQLNLLQDPLMGHCLAEVLRAEDWVEKNPEQASLRRHPIILPHKSSLSGIMEAPEWHREHSGHGCKEEVAIGTVPTVGYPTVDNPRSAEYRERPDLQAAGSPRRSIINMPLNELGIDGDGSAIAPGHPPSSRGFKAEPGIGDATVTNHQLEEHHRVPDIPAAGNRWQGNVSESEVEDGEPASSHNISDATPRTLREVLPGVDRQASRDLLSRLAGDAPDLPEQQKKPIIWPSASQRKAPVMYAQDIADLTDHRGWLISLAETSARSLYQIDPGGTLGSGRTRQISPDEITHLESQLMMPITGPRATSQLLSAIFLGDAAGFKGRASGSGMADNPDLRLKRDIRPGTDGKTRASSHIGSSSQPQSSPAVGHISVRDPALGQEMIERVLPGIRMRSTRGFTDIGRGQDEKDRIAPLEAEPSLPPLHSSQGAKMPPMPVAAPIASSDAQKGLIEDEVDLGDLAAKIKRILDDEARRHGIDV